MTQTNNIVAKLAVAFVAVAMAFTLVAPSAKAQNVSNMSLEQLIALVNQLQAQLGGSTTSTGSFSYTWTRPLGQGSTGADVLNLQKFLNLSADTQVAPAGVAGGAGAETSFYGPATAAAVSKFQTKYSADILVPSGLTSPTGYFGTASIAKANALAKGTTGGNNGGSTTGPLKGGAGDLTITARTANTENSVTEGATENVVSFEAKADDNSDIAVTSVRVVLNVNATGLESNRANRYVDEVLVLIDDTEVGSADISAFSRSGNTHTATINLKNAVVRAGENARFYVALVARDSISSDDRTADIDVSVDRVRYEDATGAILTDNTSDSKNVTFNAASADNSLSVQNLSSTPAAKILKVNETSTSDEFHVLSFRLKTGTKTGDIDVTRVVVEVDSSATTTNLLNDIWLKVGSKLYRDYTISTSTGNVTFDIDEGDLEISGDDTENVEVYAKFNRRSGNYTNGVSVAFKVAGSDIVAEDTRGNSVTRSGNATGKDMTLSTTAATIDGFTWKVAKASSGNSGAITFRFTVDADDEDFTFAQGSLVATTTGTASSTGPTWAVVSGNATASSTNYIINSGDTATFEVTYTVSNAGTKAVTVTSVANQQVPNDKQYSGLEVF